MKIFKILALIMLPMTLFLYSCHCCWGGDKDCAKACQSACQDCEDGKDCKKCKKECDKKKGSEGSATQGSTNQGGS